MVQAFWLAVMETVTTGKFCLWNKIIKSTAPLQISMILKFQTLAKKKKQQ